MNNNITPEIREFNNNAYLYLTTEPKLLGPTITKAQLLRAMTHIAKLYQTTVNNESGVLDWLDSAAQEILAVIYLDMDKIFKSQVDLDDDREVDDFIDMTRCILEAWKRAKKTGRTLTVCGIK